MYYMNFCFSCHLSFWRVIFKITAVYAIKCIAGMLDYVWSRFWCLQWGLLAVPAIQVPVAIDSPSILLSFNKLWDVAASWVQRDAAHFCKVVRFSTNHEWALPLLLVPYLVIIVSTPCWKYLKRLTHHYRRLHHCVADAGCCKCIDTENQKNYLTFGNH